jgi:hypothetical protein
MVGEVAMIKGCDTEHSYQIEVDPEQESERAPPYQQYAETEYMEGNFKLRKFD